LEAPQFTGGTPDWTTARGDVRECDPRGATTGIQGQREALPIEFVLEQNYPSPSNPSTTIK